MDLKTINKKYKNHEEFLTHVNQIIKKFALCNGKFNNELHIFVLYFNFFIKTNKLIKNRCYEFIDSCCWPHVGCLCGSLTRKRRKPKLLKKPINLL